MDPFLFLFFGRFESALALIPCWTGISFASHARSKMSSDDDESVDQGSGWGWGWLSEAAKVAKTAYESNVKPALQSMEQATSEFGTYYLTCDSGQFGLQV